MTTPDNWVVLQITNPNATDALLKTFYKVFATWAGGYPDGDSWKINSGVDRVDEDETTVNFHGYSGSCYACKKGTYGTGTGYTTQILDNIIAQAKDNNVTMVVLPDSTDWLNLGSQVNKKPDVKDKPSGLNYEYFWDDNE
jgi:hypothetical protein